MQIAEQKKKSNIAEYILYMYQVEDVIRGYNFDLDRIMNIMFDRNWQMIRLCQLTVNGIQV